MNSKNGHELYREEWMKLSKGRRVHMFKTMNLKFHSCDIGIVGHAKVG